MRTLIWCTTYKILARIQIEEIDKNSGSNVTKSNKGSQLKGCTLQPYNYTVNISSIYLDG